MIEIFLVMTLIALLSAFAIPSFLRSRILATEAVAIGSCRIIASGCQSYFVASERKSYPVGLEELATANPAYIDPVLASGVKQGYRFLYTPSGAERFELRAEPMQPGLSGVRYFYLDESGVLRVRTDAPAGPSDAPVGE